MQSAVKLQTTILPGHRIEVATPDIPEGASVELVIYRLPDSEQPLSALESLSFRTVYPEALNREYEALIQTQWQRTLSGEEQARLETVKAEMDALNAISDTPPLWEQKMAHIRQQLAALREDVEALPDAT